MHIIGQAPKDRLPFELWKLIETRGQNSARFDDQKKEFRTQVSTGHGFGPSPLFPPNLLPPLDTKAGLARCMMPRFRREPLPERAPDRQGSLYELAVPHPGLSCGFTQAVFDSQEYPMLPPYLSVAGTDVNFATGFVSSNANVHCPFLAFERARGARQDQLETANNQCAIAGAWCMRAVHMLFNKAYKATVIPDLPAAFTCVIDNSFAILNYHWIDHAQEFYMAPLCKFDLKNDTHFTKFLIWIEAIGDWGFQVQLPKIRSALSRLVQFSPTPTVYSIPSLTLSPTTHYSDENGIVRALKTTFDSIPWRIDPSDFTPISAVSSSTASWGSPGHTMDDFTPVSRASTHSWGSPCEDGDFPYPSGPTQTLRSLKKERPGLNLTLGKPTLIASPPPPPNPTMKLQNRLDEAQDEIRDLKNLLEQLRKEYNVTMTSMQNALTSVTEVLSSMLRKENMRGRTRSFSVPSRVENCPPLSATWHLLQSEVPEPRTPEPKTAVQAQSNDLEAGNNNAGTPKP
jgi:hypothetical protein